MKKRIDELVEKWEEQLEIVKADHEFLKKKMFSRHKQVSEARVRTLEIVVEDLKALQSAIWNVSDR